MGGPGTDLCFAGLSDRFLSMITVADLVSCRWSRLNNKMQDKLQLTNSKPLLSRLLESLRASFLGDFWERCDRWPHL